MPSPFPHLPPPQRGNVHVLRHKSSALADNPWGDPAERDVAIYTPAGYQTEGLPAIVFLAAYAGTGEKFLARGLQEISLANRIDRLIAQGCPPFVAVLPDVMTTLGGSQFVDSAGIGNYATWLTGELVPWLRRHLGVGRIGVAGKSSGGFGALHLAIRHPGVFAAAACHSGDLGFDLCYLAELPAAVRAIDTDPVAFVKRFWSKDEPSSAEFSGMATLCTAAAYGRAAPGTALGVDLPFDPQTGRVFPEVLADWQRYDPATGEDVAALRNLCALYLDCGDRDEHALHFGARRLVTRLQHAGINHEYQEFAGGHRNTSHRWDVSLPKLAAALAD